MTWFWGMNLKLQTQCPGAVGCWLLMEIADVQMQPQKGSLEEVCLRHEMQIWELVSVLYADIPSEQRPAIDGERVTLGCYCVKCGMASISLMLLVTGNLAISSCQWPLGAHEAFDSM